MDKDENKDADEDKHANEDKGKDAECRSYKNKQTQSSRQLGSPGPAG